MSEAVGAESRARTASNTTVPASDTTGPARAMERVARMSLALPGVSMKPSQGAAAYQVRGKSFGMVMHDHHGNGRTELWVKGSPDAQQEWVAGDGDRYYVPPYVGPNGWIGVWLDLDVDWPATAELLVDGYLVQAGPSACAGLDPGALSAVALAAGGPDVGSPAPR